MLANVNSELPFKSIMRLKILPFLSVFYICITLYLFLRLSNAHIDSESGTLLNEAGDIILLIASSCPSYLLAIAMLMCALVTPIFLNAKASKLLFLFTALNLGLFMLLDLFSYLVANTRIESSAYIMPAIFLICAWKIRRIMNPAINTHTQEVE